MVKCWGFDFFPSSDELDRNFDPLKSMEYFQFYIDLWVSAESLGFEGLFFSEHHFGGGYSPSPNLLLPVIAQRTKTLRLGVMGNVVPYHNPWRLVEEFGMLDHLLGGRLEIGTSAGVPVEFRRIGMETGEARARYEEAMRIIDAGIADGVVTHRGEYWNFDNLVLVPRPVQQPRPPIWTTVISVESARKAARRGSKIATGFVTTEKAREIFDAYNDEAVKVGNLAGPDQLALRRQVIVYPDEVTSTARGAQFAQVFRERLESADERTIAPGRKALDQPGTHGYALGDDEFLSGAPDQIAALIKQQCELSGAGHFLAVFAGHQSLQELERSWEIFGRQIIPQV